MRGNQIHKIILSFAALVWLGNGLGCKVMNLVPKHQEIVERVLGIADGRTLTILIGVSEILMAVWIVSRLFSRVNVAVQVSIVLLMNIIEQVMAGDLLLWGRFNFVFAMIFCGLIIYNEVVIKRKIDSSIIKTGHV